MANFVSYEQMQVIAGTIGDRFAAVNESITDTQSVVSDEFDDTKTYNVGDIVVYDNALYKCTAAHSGEWDPDDFDKTSVAELIDDAKTTSDYSGENLFIH